MHFKRFVTYLVDQICLDFVLCMEMCNFSIILDYAGGGGGICP